MTIYLIKILAKFWHLYRHSLDFATQFLYIYTTYRNWVADVKSPVEKLKDNTAIMVVVAEWGVIGFTPGIRVTFTTCFKDPLIALA